MKTQILTSLVAALALAACSAQSAPDASDAPVANKASASSIISQSATAADKSEWGTFYPYFTEDTHALKSVLVGVAKIDVGKEIHPPHRHGDEEYLMVTKGKGTWYLNGVETPAKEGDILFARAWDYHGIKAAPDSPLEFVVFKYFGKDTPAPTDPNPALPEELAE